jgi:hypothetical protein
LIYHNYQREELTMDKVTIELVAEETVTDGELVELGSVSEDTKGSFFGRPDGGLGYCYC